MQADVIPLDPAAREVAAAASLPDDDLAALRRAVATLERSTLVGRLSAMAGRPLEILGSALPAAAGEVVSRATEAALKAALKVALTSLRPGIGGVGLHRAAAVASGAFGGALGLATLPVELPVSTVIMLRAIAEVARDAGEDLSDPETALACLEVFALGSNQTGADNLAQGAYFAVRSALAKTMGDAARLAAGRGLADSSAPALVRFVAQIGARFGVVVSQKVAAAAVPVLGAIGGAAVNAAFLDHFRTLATAHFTVRRLERAHGKAAVRQAYEAIRTELAA